MFYEIKRCTYCDVDDFFEKYFERRLWSGKSKAIYNAIKKQYKSKQWNNFSDLPNKNDVWEWLFLFQNKYLSDSPEVLYTTKNISDFIDGETQRQLNLIVKKRDIEINEKHDWKDVRVIEKLKRSKSFLKKILLQLIKYMRDVFTAQLIRRFVHGFFLHDIIMKLWVFDRSDPYSSGEFDIHEKLEKFIRVIAKYVMINDKKLRLNTFIKLNDTGQIITISTNAIEKENRMQLNKASFVKQRAIVCRSTTCFRSDDQASVVKFSWISDKRLSKANHLQLTLENELKDIAKVIKHQRSISINELRSGLTFSSSHKFRVGIASTFISFFQTQLNQSFDSLQNLSISKTLSKRKRPEDKRNNQKKFRSDSQRFKLNQQYKAMQSAGESAVSLFEFDDDKYNNRVFECLAIASTDRALNEFTQKSEFTKSVLSAIRELLITLRNVFKAHRFWYLKENISHRNISENNIIITNSNEVNDFAEMLIDLDLAKVPDRLAA